MDAKTYRYTLLLAALLMVVGLFGQQAPIVAHHHHHDHDHHHHGNANISFIENAGQWEKNILYKTSTGGINTIYLEENNLTYSFAHSEDLEKVHDLIYATAEDQEAHIIRRHAYKVHFKNARSPRLEGIDKNTAYHNYILGNDPDKWASHVSLYNKIKYHDLYEGIHLETYSSEGHFKYDFVVMPGADPLQIILDFEGTDGLELDNGNLVIHTTVETIVESRPYAYQVIDGKQKTVNCEYELNGDQIRFEFPNGYDLSLPLIIDPTVVAATLSGTTGSANFGHTATYDNGGNIYAGGISFGLGYPATTGAFQTSFNLGETDIAFSKYNPAGSNLIYATYLGGSNIDYPYSMVTDFDQQIYIMGTTNSNNFPTTSNAFQNQKSGKFDIIVTKLNSSGSGLVGSTFIGGSEDDGINAAYHVAGHNHNPYYNYGDRYRGEIIIDGQGNAYVATCSNSYNFPVTSGAFNTTFNNAGQGFYPAQDGVVFKLNSDLSTLFWSTYLGESEPDIALGLRLDDYNNVYVTGIAGSSNFPTTPGTVQPNWNGGEEDAFVVKLSADGKNMLYGTFWGTSSVDHSYFIDIDEEGNIHIYGQTRGTMPITPNTYFYNSGSHQFLASFTADLSTLVYSTVIGKGTGQSTNQVYYDFVPVAFMVDKCNNIYFSGYYAGSGLPTTPDAIESSASPYSFYLGVLEPNASALSFGTYYGKADHVDGGTSRFDKSGTVYQGVCSFLQPGAVLNTLPNAYAANQTNYCDIGVFKIDFEVNTVTAAATALPSTSGCAPFTVNFSYTGQDATSLLWNFDDGTTSTQLNPVHTFSEAGNYRVMQIATAPNTCNQKDTFYIDIVVFDGSSNSTELVICDLIEPTYLDVTTTNASYQWQNGSTGATFIATSPGVYWVDISIPGCTKRDSFTVMLTEPLDLDLGPDFSVCDQPSFTLDATTPGAVAYQWQNGSTNPELTIFTAGQYSVEVVNPDGCHFYDFVDVQFGTTPTVELEYVDTLCDWDSYTFQLDIDDVNYQWPDGSTDNTFTVYSAGEYWVTVSNNGCDASDTIQINYHNDLLFSQSTTDVLCYEDCNGIIEVSASGGNGPLSYSWSTGDAGTSLEDLCPGAYDLTITDDICIYETTFFIQEPDPLAFELVGTDIECHGDGNGVIEVMNLTGGTPPFTFSLDNGPYTGNSYFGNLSGGDYEIAVLDANDCFLSASINLYEPPGVSVDAGPDLEIELGESIRINSMVFPVYDNLTINWTPADSLDCVDCMQPVTAPTSTTQYIISVIDDITGCVISDTVLIRVVKNRNVYIPNAFTPNGDGVNDIFRVFTGNGVRRINKIRIFDRWGEMVYEANNIFPNDTKMGWNGEFRGQPMNNAVFAYYIEVEFIDDIIIPYKGDITLLK